jgi:hypothetical protein
MKLVRKSVFETNSSSCHSLTLGSSDIFEGYTPDADNRIVLDNMCFGWEQDTYHDVGSRMAYVWIYIRDWTYDETQTKFLAMFNKVVMEHTGASEITMREEREYGTYLNKGYIDHQSVESGDLHHMFESESILKSFLFDRDSQIETDNDNH